LLTLKDLFSSSIITALLISIITNTVSLKNHHKKPNNDYESQDLRSIVHFFKIKEPMSQISLQKKKNLLDKINQQYIGFIYMR
jgi:hypothetical protein